MKALIFAVAIAAGMTGCKAIAAAEHKLDNLSDDQLAGYLELGAQATAKYGIQMASKKFPNEAPRIKTDAIALDNLIRQVVLPAFSGAPTAQVLTQMVQQISAKVRNTTLDAYELPIQAILLDVPLPPLPTDKLSPRTVKGIVGFFSGVAEGIESAENLPGPTPAPVPPPPAPAPTPPPNK